VAHALARCVHTSRLVRFARSFARGIHYEAAVKKPQDDTPHVRGKPMPVGFDSRNTRAVTRRGAARFA